jgi:hypothetical protein
MRKLAISASDEKNCKLPAPDDKESRGGVEGRGAPSFRDPDVEIAGDIKLGPIPQSSSSSPIQHRGPKPMSFGRDGQ